MSPKLPAIKDWLLITGCCWLLVSCQTFPANSYQLPTTTNLPPTVTLPPVFTTIFPDPIEDYLPNPLMGWQNTRNASPRFVETVAYARFNWNELQPAPDVYNWLPIETWLAEAVAEGKQGHFRVRATQPPPWGPGAVIPTWLMEQSLPTLETERGTEPIYYSCQFLSEHGKFVEALRLRFDGHPHLAFLDIGSYGFFGEWGSPQYDDTPNSLDWFARRHIADMYLGGQGKHPCLQTDGAIGEISYTYAGFQQTQLLMPYTPWRSDSLVYALSRRDDLGIRHDALGSFSHQARFREEIGTLVEQTWRHNPIVFELSSEADTPEKLTSALAFVEEMHASLVHDNLGGRGDDATLEAILQRVGYRLVLQQMRYTAELSSGQSFVAEMVWENAGTAPAYEEYPFIFYLTDSAGTIHISQKVVTDVRQWLPNQPIRLTLEFPVPVTIPPGNYQIEVAFVHSQTQKPALQLAIAGKQPSGRYYLDELTIR